MGHQSICGHKGTRVMNAPVVDAFAACLAVTLGEEGGYADNPKDPGGITNLGMTKASWESWVGHPVTVDTMRELTPEDVAPCYRVRYWMATGCDKMPRALALCVFDFAVNCGDGRAVMELQSLLGVAADGHVGSKTLQALNTYLASHNGPPIAAYQQRRRNYYARLDNFGTFGKGWLARTDRITAKAALWN